MIVYRIVLLEWDGGSRQAISNNLKPRLSCATHAIRKMLLSLSKVLIWEVNLAFSSETQLVTVAFRALTGLCHVCPASP